MIDCILRNNDKATTEVNSIPKATALVLSTQKAEKPDQETSVGCIGPKGRKRELASCWVVVLFWFLRKRKSKKRTLDTKLTRTRHHKGKGRG